MINKSIFMISNIFNVKSIDEDNEDARFFWQKKFFNYLFLILLVIGIVPYILSCKHAFETSEWHRIIFYTLIYLWACGVTFLKKIPFQTRVWAGISGFYLIGIVSILSTDMIGSTKLYLLWFVAFSAVTLSLAVLIKALEISGSQFKHLIKNLEEEQEQLKERLLRAEKLKALGILAGTVAHDLNNILSGIATYPEVLMMDDELDPRARQGLNIIKDSGQKASAVVSDLLTISRASTAEMEVININSIIDRYCSAHDFDKIRKTYQHIKIEILTEPELLNIKGSYIHIEKIIMNLVLNAVDEVSGMEGDNGKILITTSNSYIDSSNPEYEDIVQGEYVILSVIDNGPGIDENNLKKIFDPFFTKKELGKSGSGLGLTVVWNVVRDHNGFINVISNNKGTKFDLLFPAIRQEIPQKTKSGSFDEIKGQGQVILVVDDLKDQQKIALSILETLGYQGKAVDNGSAAVEFIKNNPTDLVILNMIMTHSISGLETYQKIKKINPGQKIIIASGYFESEDVLTAQNLGAESFVKKPYTLLDMGIAVTEELEK